MRERSADLTEATVDIDASPRQVYEAATNYRLWPALFTDITSVKVEGGPRDQARVRFRSRVLDREVTVQFDNIPDRAIRFLAISGAPGGKARGEYLLTPLDGGRRTRVTARLFLKIVGPAAMVVSKAEARSMRQRKLRADLSDTQHFMHKRTAAAALSAKAG
ncbi:MAG: SRPBCC family protein [Kofleriaceae bacterium]|nr:SRPBCC family protein [Kofleriaceae bacterium]